MSYNVKIKRARANPGLEPLKPNLKVRSQQSCGILFDGCGLGDESEMTLPTLSHFENFDLTFQSNYFDALTNKSIFSYCTPVNVQ